MHRKGGEKSRQQRHEETAIVTQKNQERRGQERETASLPQTTACAALIAAYSFHFQEALHHFHFTEEGRGSGEVKH